MRAWDGLLLTPVLFCVIGLAVSVGADWPDLIVWPAVGVASLAALVVWGSARRRQPC